MSERNVGTQITLAVFGMIFIIAVMLFAADVDSKLRDLQRRVGTLEESQK